MDAQTPGPAPVPPPPTAPRLTRLEGLALTLSGLVVLGACLYGLFWPTTHTVYPIYALAAEHWQSGGDLYAYYPPWDKFRYSPLVAVATLPYAALPLGWGGAAWRLTCGLVLLGGVVAWFRWLLAATAPAGESILARRRLLALLVLLVLPLAVTNLRNAQANPLVLGLVLLALAGAARGRWTLSAVAVAGGAFLKIYPLAVGMLLGLVYPRRFALRLAAALTAGLAAPFLFQDPHYVAGQYASWVHQNAHDRRQDDRSESGSYRNVLLLLPGRGRGVTGRQYQGLQLAVAAGIALLGLAARLRRWPSERLLPLLLSLVCCWMTGFGPASEGPTYVLLAASAAWVVVDAFRRPAPPAARCLAVAVYALVLAGFISAGSPAVRAWTSLAHPAAAVLLLLSQSAGAIVALVREPARPGQPRTGIAQTGAARAA